MRRILGAALAALIIGAPAAYAEGSGKDMAEGEVRKVDKEQRKVTVKHGEIKNLEMPAMTMVFRVKDAALLDKVKEGDRIKFAAEKIEGNITITQIEADAPKSAAPKY